MPFEAFDAQWRETYRDRWEVAEQFGLLRVSCPHGWSGQPRDLSPDAALAAHLDACPECRSVK